VQHTDNCRTVAVSSCCRRYRPSALGALSNVPQGNTRCAHQLLPSHTEPRDAHVLGRDCDLISRADLELTESAVSFALSPSSRYVVPLSASSSYIPPLPLRLKSSLTICKHPLTVCCVSGVEYLGHEIEISGTIGNSAVASSSSTAKDSAQPTIQFLDVNDLSSTCKSSK
jgi:hypothetical protein